MSGRVIGATRITRFATTAYLTVRKSRIMTFIGEIPRRRSEKDLQPSRQS